MKRLFYLILLLFICSSCNEFLERRDSYEKSRVKKIQEENILVDSTCTEMKNVYFDGHEYVVYTEVAGYGYGAAMVHSPNCKCFKNN